LAFIGCGVMAESIISGLLRRELVRPDQICASHPREERRHELKEKFGINTFAGNANAAASAAESSDSIVVLCTKPQKIDKILQEIGPAVAPGQIVISIVAGTRIEKISEVLGTSKVVRAMPNTPSQIGHGITAWTCTSDISEPEKEKIQSLLTALGRELYVETENMIDMATSLSATGPTYIFLVMEALTDAGVHLGFSRDMSKELVQETMLGSVLFAIESDLHPAELRNMVTSPGGTSADAIYQMEKGSLRTVLSKAVFAAYNRASALGGDD
jgi:pyrroline-5-carboxylate reductase